MKNIYFKEKYPVRTVTFAKDEIKLSNIDEIISYFKEKVDSHPIATFIAIFDHYNHTKSLPDHEIADDIKDAKNIIFCFGKEIPVPAVTAVRPRSIGVVEMEDSFVISFLEAPNDALDNLKKEWVLGLKK